MAADDPLKPPLFPTEHIPDTDSVFMRAHLTYYRDGELMPGVFKAKNGGMSVDWGKYSTAEETQRRAKESWRNGVLKMAVADIRNTDNLDVEHRPEPNNRAHSEIDLPEDDTLTEIRLSLLRIAKPVIAPTAS